MNDPTASYEHYRDRMIRNLRRDAGDEGHCDGYRRQAAAAADRLERERDGG